MMEGIQSLGLTDGGPGAGPQAEKRGNASAFTHSSTVLGALALCPRIDWSSQGPSEVLMRLVLSQDRILRPNPGVRFAGAEATQLTSQHATILLKAD